MRTDRVFSNARRIAAGVVAIAFAFASAAHAADEDLPGRVGRVADFGGQLFVAPEERATDWTEIGLNQPITTGDNLWVGADGRAEIDYGGGQFRLAGDTNVHVSRLDDRTIALFVAQGRAIVRVRVLDAGDVAYVDTPNAQVQLTRAGLYRIDVDPNGETTAVVVREGEASVVLAGLAQQALPGQTAVVAGASPSDVDVRNGAGVDGFDTWSASRDRHYERARSAAYVSRQMVGYADLDAYGEWQTSPTYGPVWYPQAVVSDWAPYRFGHWTWIAGYGYAWVDDAPWGYAPFHYGRWIHAGGRWGWCPGQYVVRPIWSPALVAWYGGGSWSVSANFGAPVYGWVPLAWGEPFHPWWGRCSNNCWVRYNKPYAVDVAHRPARPPAYHVNARVPGAMTAVAGATLAAAKPVAINRVPVQGVAQAPVLATAPSVKPMPGGAPAVRPGTGNVPPPASTLYPAARVRAPAAPAYSAPAVTPSGSAPAARNARPDTGASSSRGVDARARGESVPVPSTSGAPSTSGRAREYVPPRQEGNVTSPTSAPASGRAREYVPPRQEGNVAPPTSVPASGRAREYVPPRQEGNVTLPTAPASGRAREYVPPRQEGSLAPQPSAPAARAVPPQSADQRQRSVQRQEALTPPPTSAGAPAMRGAPAPATGPLVEPRPRQTGRESIAVPPPAPAPRVAAPPAPPPHIAAPAVPPPAAAQGARHSAGQAPAQGDKAPANPRAAPPPQDAPARP